MTQDEFLEILWDQCDFSEMSKQSLLRNKYNVTNTDDLPRHLKSELIDYLKEFRDSR